MAPFAEERAAIFQRLVGGEVRDWIGCEMAFREHGADGNPKFTQPAFDFLQFWVLLALIDDRIWRIGTFQNLDGWGLSCDDELTEWPAEEHVAGSIYRTRRVPELPLGSIDAVETRFDEYGEFVAATWRMGARRVLLEAGEVYEDFDGTLRVIKPDESVLVTVAPSC